MFSYQTGLRRTGGNPLLLNISGGLYDGYADFRSVWIDERFRQINETSPFYSIAQPRGWNIAAGARWEYMHLALHNLILFINRTSFPQVMSGK